MIAGRHRAPALDGGGSATWPALAVVVGLLVGLTLPVLLETRLEFHLVGLALLVAGGILTIPGRRTFDDGATWKMLVAFVALICFWPHYVSLKLPGLPWISPIRVVLAIGFFMWLYALRVSPTMRGDLARDIRAYRVPFVILGVFVAAEALSVPTARDPGTAITKFAFYQLYWVFPIFAVVSMVRDRRRLAIVMPLLIVLGLIQCLIGFQEARQERILWLDYLPPGFGADSEFMARVTQGTFRADGYRVQGSWTVSLIYAEFLVIVLPFALFAFLEGRARWLRALGLVTSVAILPAVFLSGSRLGMVGALVIFVLLLVVYVLRRWREDRRSMIGPLYLLLLPFALVAFGVAYVSSPRLQAMTIGGGQHQASTDSRWDQVYMGLPKVAQRPLFGHGIGLGNETLGFANLAGVMTIDNYWLSLVLEVGLVGFVAWFALFGWAIHSAVGSYLKPRDGPNRLGGPIALSLIAFLVVKLVLSTPDTHTVPFLLVGLAIVIRRLDDEASHEPAAGVEGAERRVAAPKRRSPERPMSSREPARG